MPLWAQSISKSPGAPAVVYGVILILVVLALPGGASGLIARVHAADAPRARLSEALTLGGYHRPTCPTRPDPPIPEGEPSTMNRKLTLTCLALVASLALGVTAALAGTARGGDDPGVTSTSILLGGTAPLTGPRVAVRGRSRAAPTPTSSTSTRKGGVNGRKITYKVRRRRVQPRAERCRSRGSSSSRTRSSRSSTRSAPRTNLAVRPYLNALKVPQLFVASGATTWGRDYAQYPYTIGFQPSYQAEGWVYGKYLARTAPGATIAVLFQNDDYGKDLLGGLKRGLQRSKVKVIAAQPYEATAPDVSSQIAKLKSSGADTLAIFATPTVRDPGVPVRGTSSAGSRST